METACASETWETVSTFIRYKDPIAEKTRTINMAIMLDIVRCLGDSVTGSIFVIWCEGENPATQMGHKKNPTTSTLLEQDTTEYRFPFTPDD
jgi:hypothetical protein